MKSLTKLCDIDLKELDEAIDLCDRVVDPNIAQVDQFLAGMRACERGEPCDEQRSHSFQRGYAVEYEREQVMTEISMRNSIWH